MANPRFVARFEAKNLRLEIWINGIPAGMIVPGEFTGVVSLPLNELIIPGRNLLGIILHASPIASRSNEAWADDPAADSYLGPASLRLRAGVYESGQSVQGGDPEPVLAEIDWEGVSEPLPAPRGRAFEGVDAMGRWAWQDAPALAADDPAVVEGAFKYLSKLHEMLAAGQFEAFLEENTIKIEEYARAYGISARPVRRDMLAALRSEAPRMKLRPLTPADVDFRFVANRRMIQCLRKDRHPALEFTGVGRETFFLPAMLGLVDYKWRLLR